ncbi:MAG: fibronectin type III domain-containing protein [Clostridia bacterium]|nr:fibronectin type III domain-containing protein [Clostridia bacterium]
MKYLFHSLSRFRISGTLMILRVKTDGDTLFVSLRMPDDSALPALTLSVEYDGVVKAMTQPTAAEMQAEFDYDDAVKQLSIWGATVSYNEQTVTSLSWRGGISDPDPAVSVVVDGARMNCANTVRVLSETAGAAGLNLRLVEVRMFDRSPGNTAWRHRLFNFTSSFMYHPHQFYVGADMRVGSEFWFRFFYAAYPPADESDHDAYLGVFEMDTEHAFVTGEYAPLCPREVRVSNASAGADARVSWVIPPDTQVPATGIELERSVDGGTFTAVTSGMMSTYTDRLPALMNEVEYRVRSVASGGETSPWVTASPAEEETCNLSMRIGGAWKTVAGIWVGVNGRPAAAKKTVLVGH